jgi:hypothetical protein
MAWFCFLILSCVGHWMRFMFMSFVACHVHICGKCDFLYSTIVVIMFCGIVLDLAFLVGWLILFLLLNWLISL